MSTPDTPSQVGDLPAIGRPATNALVQAGITTLAQVAEHPSSELLALHGVDLVFAEMKGPVKDRLLRYGMGARFSPEHFYPTTSEAVRAFQREGREA